MSKVDYHEMDGEAGVVAAPVVAGAIPSPQAKQVIEVVAPAALGGGYLLTVDLNGSPATVVVPEGGVEEGQLFVGQVVGSSEPGMTKMNIPVGQWRDGICDCCAKRACGPVNWLACCCIPVSIAQVMTRMNLDWFGGYKGNGAQQHGGWSTFRTVVVIFAIFLAVDQTLQMIYTHLIQVAIMEQYGTEDADLSVPFDEPLTASVLYAVDSGIQLLFGLYMLIITIRTRAYIREKYAIQEVYCTGCEDCCCSFFCGCCTVTQMARHTADYDTYPPSCCTETGLPLNAPEIL